METNGERTLKIGLQLAMLTKKSHFCFSWWDTLQNVCFIIS